MREKVEKWSRTFSEMHFETNSETHFLPDALCTIHIIRSWLNGTPGRRAAEDQNGGRFGVDSGMILVNQFHAYAQHHTSRTSASLFGTRIVAVAPRRHTHATPAADDNCVDSRRTAKAPTQNMGVRVIRTRRWPGARTEWWWCVVYEVVVSWAARALTATSRLSVV